MKAGLDIKISKYTLWALLTIVVVALAMFFFVGFGGEVVTLKKIDPSETVDKKSVEKKCPFVKFDKTGKIASTGYIDGDLVPKADADSMVTVKSLNAEFEIGPDKSFKLLRSPEHTDTLIYLMYILTIVPLLLICIYMSVNFVLKLIDKPAETLKGSIGIACFIVLCVVSYVIASSALGNTPEGASEAPLFINGEVCTDFGAMITTDFFLYVQYVLLVLCIVLTIISITGLLKFVNNVKETSKES